MIFNPMPFIVNSSSAQNMLTFYFFTSPQWQKNYTFLDNKIGSAKIPIVILAPPQHM